MTTGNDFEDYKDTAVKLCRERGEDPFSIVDGNEQRWEHVAMELRDIDNLFRCLREENKGEESWKEKTTERKANIEDLKGKIILKIDGMEGKSEQVIFYTEDQKFRMYHEQEYSEEVYLEDVCGDPKNLIGEPVLVAEERSNEGERTEDCVSCTWTFYELATIKGAVTLRWYGESNGYYSESVDFEEDLDFSETKEKNHGD